MSLQVDIVVADNTTLELDAIVNAANSSLGDGGWRRWRHPSSGRPGAGERGVFCCHREPDASIYRRLLPRTRPGSA